MTAANVPARSGAAVESLARAAGRTLGRTAPVVFALLALLALALQAYHFAGRSNYRDDEIRTVHAGMTMTPVEVIRWMSVDIHPPLWRVSATIWVAWFGPAENVTRFQSSLFAALALALLYRLAADLFGRRVALLGVFVAGTHTLFIFYAHEFRPYAALLMWTLAMQVSLLRWLKRPGFAYGTLYVLSCAGALYTHFFAVFVLAAQIAAFLILVRPGRGIYRRAFGLWLAAGLSFFGWLPSFLHSFLVAQPGGIEYGLPLNDPGSASVLFNTLQVRPYPLGNLLIGIALLVPLAPHLRGGNPATAARFRFEPAWRKWYPVVFAVAVGAAAVATERFAVSVLTQRNFVVIVPSIALLAALGLRALPWQAALVTLALLLNPAVREFVDYQRNQPYQEVLAFIAPDYQDHSPVIVSVDGGTGSYFTYNYYLLDRLPGRIARADFFNLSPGEPDINLPDPPANHIADDAPPSLARFTALIENAEQVWWISSLDAAPFSATYRSLLEASHTPVSSVSFDAYGNTYTVDAYRRRG